MPSDSAFKRLPVKQLGTVQVCIEDQMVTARQGDSVAAAALAAGFSSTRTTPISETPRAPYCMMGVCFECLMEINGQPNTQACMTTVSEGMQVRFQKGARELLETPS